MSEKVETANSPWASLRELNKKAREERDPLYRDCPVMPGVVLKYRYVKMKKTGDVLKRVAKIPDAAAQSVAFACQNILQAIDEILIVSPDGEIPIGRDGERELYPHPLKPLAPDGEPPMRFDDRLAEAMGFPKGNAQTIVREMFAQDDYAICGQSADIMNWLQSAAPDVSADFEEALGKA